MPTSLLCPRCEYRIRTADAAPGNAIRCPSCRERVEVPESDAPGEPDLPDAEEWGDEQPRPSKRSAVLPLAIGAGSALALLGLGLAVMSVSGGKPTPPPAPRLAKDVQPPQVRPAAGAAKQAAPPPVPPGKPIPEVFEDPFLPPDAADADAVAALDTLAKRWPAIPQDAERAAKLRESRLVWAQRTTVRAFERVGQTDAGWSKPARDALALKAGELAVHPEFSHSPGNTEVAAALADAVAAGCDDPLVLYFHHRALRLPANATPQQVAEVKQVARRLWDSGYHDIRKAQAAQNLLITLRTAGGNAADLATWEGRFWDALGRAARDPDPITQDHVIALAGLHDELAVVAGGSRLKSHEEFMAALERAEAPEYTRKVLRGEFLVSYAWDARGGGAGATVGETAFKLFEERLEAAEKELTAAFNLDPDRPQAPTRMIAVCMGRGHSRAVMEKWFARAMTADPDNARACSAKLLYLAPKWHGAPDRSEAIGFAWQCVRTANTVGMLPSVAFSNLAVPVPRHEELTPEVRDLLFAHYSSPALWWATHAAATVVRRARPDLTLLRGEHARLACVAGRFDVAKRALDAMGADFAAGGFTSAEELNFYRTWATTGRAP
jgi:hypothetical protein